MPAAALLGYPLRLPPCHPAGSRRSPLLVLARRRSTQRATDQAQPPSEPSRTWSASPSGRSTPFTSRRQQQPRSKEPFEAELLVLFGLPALIIILPWAAKDPSVLGILAVPFLIPGVRDVLLTLLQSIFSGLRRAKKFMREDDPRRQQWRAPPPPPPPPPPGPAARGGKRNGSMEEFVYDLGADEFQVVSVAPVPEVGRPEVVTEGTATTVPPQSDPTAAWANEDAMYEEERGERQQRSVSAALPPKPVRRRPRRSQAERAAAATRGWEEVRLSTEKEEESTVPGVVSIVSEEQQRRPMPRPRTRRIRTAGEDLGSRRQAGTMEREGRGWMVAPAGPHPRRRRRVFKSVPWYLQPIVSLFPFLRYWGGFM